MRHVVILAHPNPASFNGAVVRAYAGTVEALGHTVEIRDLYQMDFDPRLKAGELPDREGAAPEPDVVLERAQLEGADTFAFIYPLWFNGPPAILKGYVDRVFGRGFGYEFDFGGTRPLLTGRNLISITTSGAPDEWVRQTGAFDALLTLFDRHLCAVTGLTFLDHAHVGGVTPGLRPDAADAMLQSVGNELRGVFAKSP